uniref:Laminin EGF-like domain-containing protein n=1 Tax=Paramormyrops kingsleyae TaxID=1676925 RepID=A0A3B3SMP3_9TELE
HPILNPWTSIWSWSPLCSRNSCHSSAKVQPHLPLVTHGCRNRAELAVFPPASHWYAGLFLGKCVPCNCNGHSDHCLDGSGICTVCTDREHPVFSANWPYSLTPCQFCRGLCESPGPHAVSVHARLQRPQL